MKKYKFFNLFILTLTTIALFIIIFDYSNYQNIPNFFS